MDLSRLQPEDFVELPRGAVLCVNDFYVRNDGKTRETTVEAGGVSSQSFQYYRPIILPLGPEDLVQSGDVYRTTRDAATQGLMPVGRSIGTKANLYPNAIIYRPNPAYKPAESKPEPVLPEKRDRYAIHNAMLILEGVETVGPSRLVSPTRTPAEVYVQEQHADAHDVGAKDHDPRSRE